MNNLEIAAINELPESQRSNVLMTLKGRQKSAVVAFVLDLFLGALGAHHFYLGKTTMGVIYLFTLGFLGIGPLMDLFLVWGATEKKNKEIAVEIISEFQAISSKAAWFIMGEYYG